MKKKKKGNAFLIIVFYLQVWIVMEYCDGGSLRHFAKNTLLEESHISYVLSPPRPGAQVRLRFFLCLLIWLVYAVPRNYVESARNEKKKKQEKRAWRVAKNNRQIWPTWLALSPKIIFRFFFLLFSKKENVHARFVLRVITQTPFSLDGELSFRPIERPCVTRFAVECQMRKCVGRNGPKVLA